MSFLGGWPEAESSTKAAVRRNLGLSPGARADKGGQDSRRAMPLDRLVTPAALLVALAVVAVAPGTQAEPAPVPVPVPVAGAGAATCQPRQGSLALVGCSLAQQLGLTPGSASVTVLDLKSDRELPAADALRERVKTAVATALGAQAPAAKGELRKLRVELSIEKKGGVLRVTADVRRATGLWQRIRHAKPSAERHGFVEAPLDAELRALIPPPPLVVTEVLKLKAPERGIVALACGPLADDGGQELALVSRGSVRVGRIAGRVFVERKRATWSALSAVAAAPLREPIASAEITPEGTLRVGLTDRRDGLRLSRELEVLERYSGLLPVPGGKCAARSALGVLARLDACVGLPGASRTQPTTLDTVAGMPTAQLARDANGRLSGIGRELVQSPPRVGAQLAVGDADSDGNPELAYSADTLEAAKDRLTLVSLQGNKLTPRFELLAPGITAVAICGNREGPGMAPIVVAVGDELWLIR